MAVGCRYDDAGPWNGGTACSGSFLPGTKALGEALVERYGGSYQGYNCRQNTADASRLSVHGTGRAVDWFPPDKATGDEGAQWLAENHEAFGVQLVIWWHEDWSCSALDDVPGVGEGDGWTPYGGPNPHEDHVHAELTIAAAEHNTADTYEEGLTVADIRQLLDAEQDTRRLILASAQRNLEAEWQTRRLLRRAGVIPDRGEDDSDLQLALDEITERLAELG